MTRGKWLCLCQRKTEEQLLAYLRAHPGASFDKFRKKTRAGVTCESCVRDIFVLYERVQDEHRRANARQGDLFGGTAPSPPQPDGDA